MALEILVAAAVTLAGAVAVIAMQPSDFRIVRTESMRAPASAVFAQINDFHNWQAWSPWARRDPAMKQAYEGAAAGKGAVSTSIVEFTFRPEDDGTTVTWTMSGTRSVVAKALDLVMNMDRMIGGDLDEGLAAMQSMAEASARR